MAPQLDRVLGPYEAETFECIDAGLHVVVEQVLRGRSKETGLSLDARHWNVFTLADGKVVCWRFYQNGPRLSRR